MFTTITSIFAILLQSPLPSNRAVLSVDGIEIPGGIRALCLTEAPRHRPSTITLDGPFVCSIDDIMPMLRSGSQARAHRRRPSSREIIDFTIAIETDWQLYQRFGSVPALVQYVTNLVNATSRRYLADVGVTITLRYLGVHTTQDDGWTTQDFPSGSTTSLLYEFQNAWQWSSGRPALANTDLSHFLSGAGIGGGVGYMNALCRPEFAFGVSASINGNINWLTWDWQNTSTSWDFVVLAHELGHNFGSAHTHEYCPPIDRCYPNTFPGCNPSAVCSHGTIMSYCHTCPGGMLNTDLFFHPRTAEVMRSNIVCP